MKRTFLFLGLLPLLLSSMCKRDYYTGTESVRLKLSVNRPAESIRLGDTLKFTLTIPSPVTSESGIVNTVNSVQKSLYGFTFYRFDTLTATLQRITAHEAIQAAKGALDPSLGTISTTRAGAPFASVLALVPPARGLYYLQLGGSGAFKINNDYESGLRLKFDVPDKHGRIFDPYLPGFSAAVADPLHDSYGTGFYCFRVK